MNSSMQHVLLTLLLTFSVLFLQADYPCEYTCSMSPLEETYPNQNMCALLTTIPPALQGLSYVMYPCSDVYNTNRFGFDKLFNYFPVAIIVPENESQLIDAFEVLRDNHLPFSVRSGGHCWGPGSLSNGYIIDLRNFNSIVPDMGSSQVYIGTGCRLGNVISTLGAIDYAIPTGTCPSVGVGGLALGGGIGYLIRQYGLTSDSIVSIRVLTADGTIIDVDANSDPDLFWALCGAGANSFGIVIGFTCTMYYIPEVSYISLIWSWDPVLAGEIFNAWQAWIDTLPTSITSECRFTYRAGTSRVNVTGLKVGAAPFTEWQSVFEKFNPTLEVNYHGNYLGAANYFASTPIPPFSKAKSKFLFQPLPQKGLEVLTQLYSQLQYTGYNIRINTYFGSLVGGAVSTPNPNSSYFARGARSWLFLFAYWFYENQTTVSSNILRQAYLDLAPYLSPYSYSNLVDYDLGKDYLDAYYGTNVGRLINIKNTYDPTNIFTWQQGIPLIYTPQSNLSQLIEQKYFMPKAQ